MVRPADWFTPAPRGWSFTEAVNLPTAGLTAWRAFVVEGRIKPGEDILLLDSGGVATLALKLAKKMGAWVIMTSSSDEKLERAREIGIAFGVNYRRHKDWGKR